MSEIIYTPMPKNADRLAYVRGLLAMNKVSGQRLARKIGVRACTISRLLHGTLKSYRLKKGIADELGLSFEKVWGSPE